MSNVVNITKKIEAEESELQEECLYGIESVNKMVEKMPESLEPASVLIFAIFSMVELLVNEAGYSESEMRGIVEEALELAAEPSTPRVTH